MNFFKRLLPPVLALLVVGCSDTLGPMADNAVQEMPGILAGKGGPKGGNGSGGDTSGGTNNGGGSNDPGTFVLQHASDAPALETYDVSFWAIKGQKSGVSVDYSDNRKFLSFNVPRGALDKFPTGGRMSMGDSVLITLTIDPVLFSVEFAPAGLTFSKSTPAELSMQYDRANPDYDLDGDVDADDTAIMENALSVFYNGSNGWAKMNSYNEVFNKWILGSIPHFSGYAVSW